MANIQSDHLADSYDNKFFIRVNFSCGNNNVYSFIVKNGIILITDFKLFRSHLSS